MCLLEGIHVPRADSHGSGSFVWLTECKYRSPRLGIPWEAATETDVSGVTAHRFSGIISSDRQVAREALP
jgi:hypothetical protein